jgi:hypothetical protein
VPPPEVAAFCDQVAAVLARLLGLEVVGVDFVGSVALDGYIAGESDTDIAAVGASELTAEQRQQVAAAIVEVSAACPDPRCRVRSQPARHNWLSAGGAHFEVNANGGPRMPVAVHLDASAELGFW